MSNSKAPRFIRSRRGLMLLIGLAIALLGATAGLVTSVRNADAALGEATSRAGLGRDFGHGLSEAEVRYLVAREWARSADDILWRRTKLGLRFDAAARDTLAGFVAGLVG